MHIHIKPFRFSLSKKNINLKQGKKCEEQTQKGCRSSILILGISFLGQASSSPTPNPSQLCHNQITTQEKNQLCILGFLVRVDVYPIHLHLKNFMGIHKPYFSHDSFDKFIAL